jgi:high-affinity Fe2+/Pb2+ permease
VEIAKTASRNQRRRAQSTLFDFPAVLREGEEACFIVEALIETFDHMGILIPPLG